MQIAEVKRIARSWGSHFFDKETIRFFKSKICSRVYDGPGGIYFVTSEKGPHMPRRYSVRRLNIEEEDIETVGDFNLVSTRDEAYAIAKDYAEGNAPCTA